LMTPKTLLNAVCLEMRLKQPDVLQSPSKECKYARSVMCFIAKLDGMPLIRISKVLGIPRTSVYRLSKQLSLDLCTLIHIDNIRTNLRLDDIDWYSDGKR
jgi:hypothetical protein